MRRATLLAACCETWFLALFPVTARAETAYTESIEWVVASSDRIVVGKVTSVDAVKDRENQTCQTVIITVSKTLKGAHTPRETFVMPAYLSNGFAKAWMDEGALIVFFLLKNDGHRVSVPADKFAWVLRDDQCGPNAILLRKNKKGEIDVMDVLTCDFDVLTDPSSILKYVEKTIDKQRSKRALRQHSVDVPFETPVFKKLWSGSSVFLDVPVDEKLEALGRRWCRSASCFEREEGANALAYFPNERNLALLKSLLNDPTTSDGTYHETVPGKTEMRLIWHKTFYPVRKAAYDSLRQLGAQVQKPVLEVLLEGHDEPEPKPDRSKP